MKIFKLTYGLMAASVLALASCNLNEYPEFDDADAFVAIQQTSASVSENGDVVEIPVLLTSLSGLSGSVDFTITPAETAGAQEGVHYTILNDSKTLTFTKEAPSQTIRIQPIDNDTFGGDTKFTITLSNPQGVKLGAIKSCLITVEDDEHPLAFILGTMNAVGIDYFSNTSDPLNGTPEEWTATFEKDADDLSKVWIYGICSGGCSDSYPVYGIVNDEKTEIHIPVGQTTDKGSYDAILEGWYGPDGEEDIPAGGYITGKISADGTITIEDWFGAHAYQSGTTTSAGWYAIEVGATFKKQ